MLTKNLFISLFLYINGIMLGAASSSSSDLSLKDTYLTMLTKNTGFTNAPFDVDTEVNFYNDSLNPIEIIYARKNADDFIVQKERIEPDESISLGNAKMLMSVIGIRIYPIGLVGTGGWGSWLIYGDATEQFKPYEIPKLTEGMTAAVTFERSSYFGTANFHIRLEEKEGRKMLDAKRIARLALAAKSGSARILDVSTFSIKNDTSFTFIFQGSGQPPYNERTSVEIAPGQTYEIDTKPTPGGGQLKYDFTLQRISKVGMTYDTYTYRLSDVPLRVNILGETKEIPFDPYELVAPNQSRAYQIIIEGNFNWSPVIERIDKKTIE